MEVATIDPNKVTRRKLTHRFIVVSIGVAVVLAAVGVILVWSEDWRCLTGVPSTARGAQCVNGRIYDYVSTSVPSYNATIVTPDVVNYSGDRFALWIDPNPSPGGDVMSATVTEGGGEVQNLSVSDGPYGVGTWQTSISADSVVGLQWGSAGSTVRLLVESTHTF